MCVLDVCFNLWLGVGWGRVGLSVLLFSSCCGWFGPELFGELALGGFEALQGVLCEPFVVVADVWVRGLLVVSTGLAASAVAYCVYLPGILHLVDSHLLGL